MSLENLSADFERHLAYKNMPEGPHDEWMVVSDTDLEPVLRELRASRSVLQVVRDIAGNEHRYDDFPVPAAAIGWNDAKAICEAAITAFDSLINGVRKESADGQ